MRNNHATKSSWSAPKGHPKMEPNGQWETPFETAVREANEEIHYLDSKSRQWCTININTLRKYVAYLECVFSSRQAAYRRIGLFVVCLEDDYQFHPKDRNEIDVRK